MNKNYGKVALILSIITLCLSLLNVCLNLKEEDKESSIQYVMYLGTNDQNTNEAIFSPLQAKEKVEETLIKYFDGYTIIEAKGGWKDVEIFYNEDTFIIQLSDTTLQKVHEAADELLQVFNQKSIMIEINEVKTEFYSTH